VIRLLWGLQRGTSVIPKSVTASRIESNFQVDGHKLTNDEVKQLSSLPDRFKVCGDGWLPVKVFFGDDE
jgi:glycerol 2-dehydrogenase (NADP+)